jgi:hypothetical protein
MFSSYFESATDRRKHLFRRLGLYSQGAKNESASPAPRHKAAARITTRAKPTLPPASMRRLSGFWADGSVTSHDG